MHKGYSAQEINSIVNGKLISSANEERVLHFITDTRKISHPSHSLFVAITGYNHDGHHYISDAYRAGIRHFIVENMAAVPYLESASIIAVKHSIAALQRIAAHHRLQSDIPVIGITGSNGKTIVKEWLNLLLADDYVIARSPRSYNSQLGVALSVLTLETEHTLGIFEAGISMPGEMNSLREIIRPTLGIITNIGESHQENFSGKTDKAEEKLKLFQNSAALIYCSDYPEIVTALDKLQWYAEKISWAERSNATVRITDVKSSQHDSEISLTWKQKDQIFHLQFTDKASIENAIHCIVTLLYLGYSETEINLRLPRLIPLAMRLELLNGVNQCVLVNDVYSNDLHSLEIALDFLRHNSSGLDRMIILSDIQQSGLPPEILYDRVNQLLAGKGISSLIGIGDGISSWAKKFSMPSAFFPDVESFIAAFHPDTIQHKAALIKGARAFRFERITEILQEKTHETVLEIDLNALSHNLNYFRSLLLPDTRIMVMVKAFGYGSGAHEISSLLEFNKVDYLAVAYTDEGVALRKSGVSLPIMVMNPEASGLGTLVRYNLEPEIYSFRTLHAFHHTLLSKGITHSYPVHIKVDTGMHRLGFMPGEAEELAALLVQMPLIRITSVFTHLAATDEPEHDGFTAAQLENFETFCHVIKTATGSSFLMHALNTGGIQRFSGAQYDMVRLGIGLYGVSAHEDEQRNLRNVSTLRTVISQIKIIHTGESVGYGRKFIAHNEMTIATIPLGYADGLRRSLSLGVGFVLIKGHRAPIVGNVCMDMTMVDITDIACKEGDSVEVFGSGIPLVDFARMSGTIAYETLTGISQRVKRIYLQE